MAHYGGAFHEATVEPSSIINDRVVTNASAADRRRQEGRASVTSSAAAEDSEELYRSPTPQSSSRLSESSLEQRGAAVISPASPPRGTGSAAAMRIARLQTVSSPPPYVGDSPTQTRRKVGMQQHLQRTPASMSEPGNGDDACYSSAGGHLSHGQMNRTRDTRHLIAEDEQRDYRHAVGRNHPRQIGAGIPVEHQAGSWPSSPPFSGQTQTTTTHRRMVPRVPNRQPQGPHEAPFFSDEATRSEAQMMQHRMPTSAGRYSGPHYGDRYRSVPYQEQLSLDTQTFPHGPAYPPQGNLAARSSQRATGARGGHNSSDDESIPGSVHSARRVGRRRSRSPNRRVEKRNSKIANNNEASAGGATLFGSSSSHHSNNSSGQDYYNNYGAGGYHPHRRFQDLLPHQQQQQQAYTPMMHQYQSRQELQDDSEEYRLSSRFGATAAPSPSLSGYYHGNSSAPLLLVDPSRQQQDRHGHFFGEDERKPSARAFGGGSSCHQTCRHEPMMKTPSSWSLSSSSSHHHHHQQGYNYPGKSGAVSSPTVEIAPGTFVRLRGANETWSCIETDSYLPTTCLACDLELCCIQDAEYVLCPSCRVVSPMPAASEQGSGAASSSESGGGVGLGFTWEQLMKWQQEILEARQSQQARRYPTSAAASSRFEPSCYTDSCHSAATPRTAPAARCHAMAPAPSPSAS